MRNFVISLLTLIVLLSLNACKSKKAEHNHSMEDHKIRYTCPMHPQVISDQPGSCPICKMDLVPVEKSNTESPAIMLSESQIKLANVTTLPLNQNKVGNNTLLLGRVTENKEQAEVISSRVEGRIEKLFFKETGKSVYKGEPLYEIYSEPLLTLQQEFLLAQEQFDKLGSEMPRFKSFLEASRKKLLLYGMTQGQINNLSIQKKTNPNITFFAPESGLITEIAVAEGSYVPEGERLFSIDRLNKLWVEAELYPGEAKLVKIGEKLQVLVTGYENSPVTGTVKFISPEYKNNSQILLVRVEIPNPDLKFAPGMQANVLLKHTERKSISLPVDAVVRSGDGAHVWVTDGPSTFIPKLVKTGIENADRIEITTGLELTDTVVTSGAYLLYSEYTLKKGGNLMNELMKKEIDSNPFQENPSQISSERKTKVDQKFQKQLEKVFPEYLKLKEAFVASDPAKVKSAASDVLHSFKAINSESLNPEDKMIWNEHKSVIENKLSFIKSSDNLEAQRIAFAPLSESLYKTFKLFSSDNLKAYYQFCPMALDNKGAYWISDSKVIRNPYFGDEMLSCGEVKENLTE